MKIYSAIKNGLTTYIDKSKSLGQALQVTTSY